MKRTSKFLQVLGIGVATWLAAAPASADQPSPQQRPGQSQDQDQTQGQQGRGQQGTMTKMGERKSSTASVVKVDTQKRHLTLRDEQGKEFTIEVPPSVKRLDEIKQGDRIRVDYYESVALSLKKGQGAQGAGETTMIERNAGKLPSGEVAHMVTGTVDIVKVDQANNKVTIRKPNGDMDTIDVTDPAMRAELGKLKEGDKVQATYTEGAAITVMRENQGQKGQGQAPENEGDRPR